MPSARQTPPNYPLPHAGEMLSAYFGSFIHQNPDRCQFIYDNLIYKWHSIYIPQKRQLIEW